LIQKHDCDTHLWWNPTKSDEEKFPTDLESSLAIIFIATKGGARADCAVGCDPEGVFLWCRMMVKVEVMQDEHTSSFKFQVCCCMRMLNVNPSAFACSLCLLHDGARR
jgi:hypothetical protein